MSLKENIKEKTFTFFSLALIVDMILVFVILVFKNKFNIFLISTFLSILRSLYMGHNVKKFEFLGI